MNRKILTHTATGTEISFREITWELLRSERDNELSRTDWWGLKDLSMSQAKKDYRKFLRDLPQNFESANDAADAWAEYERPE